MTSIRQSDCEDDDDQDPLLPKSTSSSSTVKTEITKKSSSSFKENRTNFTSNNHNNRSKNICNIKNELISKTIEKCQGFLINYNKDNNDSKDSKSTTTTSSSSSSSLICNNSNYEFTSAVYNTFSRRKQFIIIILMVIILIYFNSSVIVWDRNNIEKISVYHHSHVPGMKEDDRANIVPALIYPSIKPNKFNSIINVTNPSVNEITKQPLATYPKEGNYSTNLVRNIINSTNSITSTISTSNANIITTTPTTTIIKTSTIKLSSSNSTIKSTKITTATTTTTTTNTTNSSKSSSESTTTSYSNNSVNSIPPPGYLVWSDKCKMPNMDPYSPDVMKYFKKQAYKECISEQPHTKVTFNITSGKYILHLNDKIETKYTKGGARLSCSYQVIERSGSGKSADKSYKFSKSLSLPRTTQLPNTTEFILVTCKSSNNKTYMNAHAMMPEKDEIRQRLNEWKKKDEETGKKPISVLFIGIDSVSRLNLIRAMPKTAQYIYDNEWFELSGYNKIEDNTFPNLMAILAGLNNTHAFERYNPKKPGLLDNCPLLWKDFRNLGYVTAYAEDETSISTFNYLKMGFNKQPTDYYIRPLLMAAENKLPTTKKSGLTFCVGYKHSADYIMDYALELGTRYKNDPYFGFFWMNTFSHNAISDCSSMDERIVDYFRKFADNGILNRSIIIFISDHGMRFGPTRILESGYYEERLPLAFLWLPTWLKNEHPEFVNSLNINKNRLTNPYDMHMTLKHILELSGRTENLSLAEDCPNCQTLLKPVPESRSCQDISIADHWCTCLPFQSVHKDSAIVRRIANYSINYINDYLQEFQNGTIANLCAKLHLYKIKSANRAITTIGNNKRKSSKINNKTIETYHLIMIAKPGDGLFESSVRHHPYDNGRLEMTGSISRLNWYGKDSRCLEDGGAKKYCYCVKNKSSSSSHSNG